MKVLEFWDRTRKTLSPSQQGRIKSRVMAGWNLRRAIKAEGLIVIATKEEMKDAKELFKEGILKTEGLIAEEKGNEENPEALCVWCGKKYKEHKENQEAELQGIPCGGKKLKFKQ